MNAVTVHTTSKGAIIWIAKTVLTKTNKETANMEQMQ